MRLRNLYFNEKILILCLGSKNARGKIFSAVPQIQCFILDFSENLYGVLDWQRVGSRRMVQHYLNVDMVLQVSFTCHLCALSYLFLSNACLGQSWAVTAEMRIETRAFSILQKW